MTTTPDQTPFEADDAKSRQRARRRWIGIGVALVLVLGFGGLLAFDANRAGAFAGEGVDWAVVGTEALEMLPAIGSGVAAVLLFTLTDIGSGCCCCSRRKKPSS